MPRILFLLSFILLGVNPSIAEVQSQAITYEHNSAKLKGVIYWDDEIVGKRPGVMVVHEWWGLNDYAKQRAKMLAEAGFIAFAADMYGDDKVTTHAEDAKGWMQQITANTKDWQQRAILGVEKLKEHELADANNLAAIGYCFGGSTVMQIAYAGTGLKGVASFHGSLPPAPKASHGKIKAKILVAHGAQDKFVATEKVNKFTESLINAGADWEMNIYGSAKHSFTNPDSANYGIDALGYDKDADNRSWARLMEFFNEIFQDNGKID